MAIVDTYRWLQRDYDDPETLCEHFEPYIPMSASYIYEFLAARGMYRPTADGKKELEKLWDKNMWAHLQKEYTQLRRWLKGPDVPIFILPSDQHNRYMQREYNGKAGLAFKQCIFLFVSSHNSIDELRAMLTHEYHHVCRLDVFRKEEKEYTLLDTIILEGLAETAVAERHSEAQHATWVHYYSKLEAIKLWNRFLKDEQMLKKGTKKHEALLNGLRFYPKMLGYCTGFYIVKDCVEHTGYDTKTLLSMKSEDILAEAKSFAAYSRS